MKDHHHQDITVNNKDGRFSDPASCRFFVLAALDCLDSKQFHPSVPPVLVLEILRWINCSQGSMSEKRLVIYDSSAIDFSRFCVNRFRSGTLKQGGIKWMLWTSVLTDRNQNK
jgi:hypothetical protein